MAAAPVKPGSGRPLVSIGLPVFNGEKYLARALQSLLAQDWPATEIIVSDNASTDGSLAIAEAFAARDSRVRLLRSSTNAGFEANFARVLDAATGSFFMWAACDDWWSPRFVSAMAAALEAAPSAAVAMSAVERVDETGLVVDVVRFRGRDDPSRMTAWQLAMRLAGGRPYHLFVYGLYRTSFIRRAFTGFAPVVAADRLLVCRVAMAGRFVYVDEVLHRRLIRAASLRERYPDEQVGRAWRRASARWRLALAAGPYLWSSPVMPASRRWWIPAIVARFMKASLGHTILGAARSASFAKIAASTHDPRTHR